MESWKMTASEARIAAETRRAADLLAVYRNKMIRWRDDRLLTERQASDNVQAYAQGLADALSLDKDAIFVEALRESAAVEPCEADYHCGPNKTCRVHGGDR